MSIKQKLKEAVLQTSNVQLTESMQDIFESVELSDDVRTKFSAVFESVVNAKAVELAESYVNTAGDKADELVEAKIVELEESAEEYAELYKTQLAEKVDIYLDHVVDKWLQENQLSIEAGLKTEMFDGFVTGLKAMFIENNIAVPEDQVNVVAELEEEIQDLESKFEGSLNENKSLKDELKEFKRGQVIESVVADLTESQKEKVRNLAESIQFDESFQSRIESIVEFATGSKFGQMTEKKDDEDDKETTDDADKASPNFKSDEDEEEKDKEKEDKKGDLKESADPAMASYISAARRY